MAYEQFSYLYDRLMEDMPYDDWLHFAHQCWDKLGTPRSVVDLGCGTGSIAVPLAQLGYEVVGIDLSEDMLSMASQKAESAQRSKSFPAGGSVMWLQQDMREWELGHPVDAVISFCDCLNYLLEEEDIERTFKQVYDGLAPGGVFVFDMHTQSQLQSYAESQPFFLNDDDVAYIWTCDFDPGRCEIEHELTLFVREGDAWAEGSDDAITERYHRIEELHVQRAYPLDWVQERLRAAGFSETACYADFSFEAPKDDTQRAFFVAVKQRD
ncbi:class I SAM-dependent DNA methyltransferase [Paenibacillus elgii]|uniref:Methyltransferase type 12 n=1 Tax=Paenibacillus elgii TaxID=189691 RepID=A0A163VZR5_9BACL|nr:class I SAM-dependent methyltransferase [Paenibacillus elgii]KZE75646.1 methyltransferase type 12 [Paenibacillus elgii]NEN81732.1 class I SAM-dependent methyltransferase [Paenibacillus elgii]